MEQIVLRRDNVVKEVMSEDAAKVLEAKGFVRGSAMKVKAPPDAGKETAALKQELAEANAQLEDACREITALRQELAGANEQLAAAVKKNVSDAKKEKKVAAND